MAVGPFTINGRIITYYLIFFAALILFLLLLRVAVNSPFGRVLQAIRDNEFRAEALGYDEKNQDVLLFIDNIFRFSQAGIEVSASSWAARRAPVRYRPEQLASEMGDLQERITSTKKGSIASFQAVYVHRGPD